MKNCKAGCKGQSYQVTVSSSVFPVPNTFSMSPMFCYVVRKLGRACHHQTRVTLEVAYPNICKMSAKVLRNKACETKFKADFVPKPFDTVEFEMLVLKYTEENIALVNVYIKDPFAVKILIDESSSK